jgi:HD superfamily phosphodiesterase
MAGIDTIKEVARQILSAAGQGGWLWGRAERIVGNIGGICRLSEIVEANMAIDMFCLTAAGYLADVGPASGSEEASSEESARIIAERLGGVLDGNKIDKINLIIGQAGDCHSKMTEAMILSDAMGLDDIGVAGIVNSFYRNDSSGDDSDVTAGWRRRLDYGYWDARLKESFRFGSVRVIAEQRHSLAKKFVEAFEVERSADDVRDELAAEKNKGR